jgi:hypothetical protein
LTKKKIIEGVTTTKQVMPQEKAKTSLTLIIFNVLRLSHVLIKQITQVVHQNNPPVFDAPSLSSSLFSKFLQPYRMLSSNIRK